jgi:hypothetical protein
MKTKNCKVRVKDIKQGVTVYRANFYGTEKIFITGRPHLNKSTNSLFVDGKNEDGRKIWFSLNDAGITAGESVNDKRTFFKRKHADGYIRKMSTDKRVAARREDHDRRCREHDEWQFEMDGYKL